MNGKRCSPWAMRRKWKGEKQAVRGICAWGQAGIAKRLIEDTGTRPAFLLDGRNIHDSACTAGDLEPDGPDAVASDGRGLQTGLRGDLPRGVAGFGRPIPQSAE